MAARGEGGRVERVGRKGDGREVRGDEGLNLSDGELKSRDEGDDQRL